jgi:hypothetical protein
LLRINSMMSQHLKSSEKDPTSHFHFSFKRVPSGLSKKRISTEVLFITP